MTRIWLLLLIGSLGWLAQAQQDLGPPCDSQNSAHRQAVQAGMAIHAQLRSLEAPETRQAAGEAIAALAELWDQLDYLGCAEITSWALISQASYVALIHELEAAPLGFSSSQALAPLLEDWRDWAGDFLAETLKTQFWLGSFEDVQWRGIRVGCDSALLPVDTGHERGRDTQAELRLALSALFDPERRHPTELETEDWIKQLGLSVAEISIDAGFAEIELGGQLRGIGTCGDAILEAQILQTVFQFADIKSARISDGERNLWEIVDMSDMLSPAERKGYIYQRQELDWLRD